CAEVRQVGPHRLGIQFVQRVHRCFLVLTARLGGVLLVGFGGFARVGRGSAARSSVRQPSDYAISDGGTGNPPPRRTARSFSSSSSLTAASRSGRRSAVRSSD